MNKKISMNEAIKAWHTYKMEDSDIGIHLTDLEIDKILNQEDIGNREELIEHIMFCSDCAQKINLKEKHEESLDYWETAWPIAAATAERKWPITIFSNNRTYEIKIRQSEKNPRKGFIKVVVRKENLEGNTVSVIDGQGKELIRGAVKKGQLIGRIFNIEEIDLHLLVRIIQ